MKPIVLFVARHAPVAVEGTCYGQSDVATSLDAASSASRIMSQLAATGVRVERVWTSPWQRTRATAAVLAEALGVPLCEDTRLSELAFGEWERRPYSELELDARFTRWMSRWREEAPPGGERLADLVDRVRAWRADMFARNEVSLAMTHAGVIRVLRGLARGLDYAAVAREPVQPLLLEAIRPSEDLAGPDDALTRPGS